MFELSAPLEVVPLREGDAVPDRLLGFSDKGAQIPTTDIGFDHQTALYILSTDLRGTLIHLNGGDPGQRNQFPMRGGVALERRSRQSVPLLRIR